MKARVASLVTAVTKLDEHTQQWGLKRFREMHARIVAVMFHLSAPWDVGGERLIHLSISNFLETGNNADGWKMKVRRF
jgi:hypothetical protein